VNALEIIDVKSSVISKVGYKDGYMFLKFIDNGWYKYRISELLFERFLKAPSKGTFLNKTIKSIDNGTPCVSPAL